MEGLNLKDDYFEVLRRAQGRDIVLFGTGQCARHFLAFHGGYLRLLAVVDNDEKKQGRSLAEIFPDIPVGVNADLLVQAPASLAGRSDADTLVLVANANPGGILKQLEDIGISCTLIHSEWAERQEAIHTLPMKKPIKQNKIVCFMYNQGGHEKAITHQLLKMNPRLDIVWAVQKDRQDVPTGVRVVSLDDEYACWQEAADAHVWLCGVTLLSEFFRKREKQYYVQVKHWPSIALKNVGPTSFKTLAKDEADMERIHQLYCRNAERMDVILTGSPFDEDSCHIDFLFDGPFVRVGSPRSDCLFDKKIRNETRNRLHIGNDEKLALVAPTFRLIPHMQNDPIYGLNFQLLHESLCRRFGGKWHIMLRLHPKVADHSYLVSREGFVFDVSHYDDSQELIAASDVVITDYSSIMFEPAFVGKPVFLYVPDKTEYLQERPLLLDYEELPFPLCESNEELCLAIEKYDEQVYRHTLKVFFDKYGVHEDGHASERAAKFVLSLLDENAK